MDYLPVVLSGVAFILAVIVALRVRSLARVPQAPVFSFGPLVNDIRANLAFPPVATVAEQPEREPSLQNAAALQRLRDFNSAFESWRGGVERRYSKHVLVRNQIEVHAERLRALQLVLPNAPGGKRQSTLLLELSKAIREISIFVVRTSDQDLDLDGTDDSLQDALDRVVRFAELTLYTPSDREPYIRPGTQEPIWVKKVRIRGLKDREGVIVSPPEVAERH